MTSFYLCLALATGLPVQDHGVLPTIRVTTVEAIQAQGNGCARATYGCFKPATRGGGPMILLTEDAPAGTLVHEGLHFLLHELLSLEPGEGNAMHFWIETREAKARECLGGE